jgi:GH43 family beta-xylosidase
MSDDLSASTFQNPVYDRSFPDPFVLRFKGEYFAFCTGFAPDGRCFGRLTSRDLVSWSEIPGAMQPLATGEPLYWAPEAIYFNGRFYLYYSVGNEVLMTIRVATTDRPDGEFVDAGVELTNQDFAIDPHVFRDSDGRYFMFYATDFLDYSHIGTGTVVDEMLDPFTLKGDPRPVTRAQFDWQVYDPARKEKGGVRWHTIEGPFVLKRKGVYYEMFSAGNWQNLGYGVSFAVSDSIEREQEWSQYSDGEKIPPILSTVPGRVVGPGHNSVITGPNGRELYCVYHRWEADHRVLAIDRMDFAGGERMFIAGPTFEPEPAPYKPLIDDRFEKLDVERWTIREGNWSVDSGDLISESPRGRISCETGCTSFLAKFSFRCIYDEGTIGFMLGSDNVTFAIFAIHLKKERSSATWTSGDEVTQLNLPARLDFYQVQELTVEADNRSVTISINGAEFVRAWSLASPVSQLVLFSENCTAAFSAFSVTTGFEDLFERRDIDLRGWKFNDPSCFRSDGLVLRAVAGDGVKAELSRELPAADHDLAINLRFEKWVAQTSIEITSSNLFAIRPHERALTVGQNIFVLPQDYSPEEFYQFRFVSIGGSTTVYVDASKLGTVENADVKGLVIGVKEGEAAFDMVRHTII